MIAAGVGGQRGKPPVRRGIPEQRNQAVALVALFGRQTAHLEHRRIKVDQPDRLGAKLPRFTELLALRLGRDDDERHPRRFLPQAVLAHAILFTEMVAVIAEQNDDGIAAMRPLVQGVEYAADLMVNEGHASQVGLDAFAKLLVAVLPQEGEPRVLWQFMNAAADLGDVEQIVVADRRQHHVIQGKKVEPLLGDVERDVRPNKTNGEEKRLLALPGEAFHGPVGRLVVAHVVVLLGKGTPVGLGACPRHVGQMVVETPPAGRLGAGAVELAAIGIKGQLGRIPVGDLADRQRPVTMIGEAMRNHLAVEESLVLLHGLARGLLVDTRDMGIVTGKEGRPGRPADRPLAMGVDEQGAPLGQAVDVRGAGLRMPIETADPIVEIIDDDEEHVRLGQGVGGSSQAQREHDGKLATSHLLGRQTVRAAKPAFKFSVARLLRRFCWPSGGSSERLPPLGGSQSAA